MRRSHLCLYALVLFALIPGFRPASADGSGSATKGVTIEDFSYLDTSGEPVDQAAVHDKRLRAFMSALRGDVGGEGRCASAQPTQGGGGIRIVGGIQKMSTLIQLAKVTIIDADARRVLFDRRYTFRGDNDTAWERAEAFVSRDVREVLAASLPKCAAEAAPPIGLAVFEFELEDTSAAAASDGVAPSDAAYLADVTNDVRQLLAQSGRYRLIDVSGADADAVKTHRLRDCGGCDAALARALGADQSLIGVVRRVSRTEYTLGFQVRDTHTGAVTSRADSGLRMGADYSWRRGAVRLVSDRLLQDQSQH